MLLPVRSSALGFASLALAVGCGPAPAPAWRPPLDLPAPPTAAPLPAAAPGAGKDVPPDTEVVQLVDRCALTKGGRVLCWGSSTFPGMGAQKVAYAPRLVEGLPPIRRLGQAGTQLAVVAVDGRTFQISYLGESTYGFQPVAIPAPEEITASSARLPDGRVYDISSHNGPPKPFDVPPIRKLFPPYDCGAAEDGNAYCWGQPYALKEVLGTIEGDKRVRIPLPRGRIKSGVGFWVSSGTSGKRHTCAVYEDNAVHCTDPSTQAVVAKWGPIRQLANLGEVLCGVLESGKMRCHVTKAGARPADQDPLTWNSVDAFGPAIDKLQGVEEISGWRGYVCARYSGKVACWGEHKETGEGIDPALSAPVLVKGLPKLVSLDANRQNHCALDAEGHAHCISVDSPVPGPFELALPEPATRYLGSSGYGCMKGAKSGKWYCRSIGFIGATTPSGFTPMLDPHGQPVVNATAVGIEYVSSIAVALPDGTRGAYYVHLGGRPLRLFTHGTLPATPKGERAILSSCLAGSDGKLYYGPGNNEWKVMSGFDKIVMMGACSFSSSSTSPDCGLDEAGAVWCSTKGGEPKREAEGAADLTRDCYVTKAGAAYCLGQDGALPFTKVEGLPEVTRAVEKCALSKVGELFCWGDRYNAGLLGRFRSEPRELTMPAATR